MKHDTQRPAIHHIDGDPRNNSPENVRVVDVAENRPPAASSAAGSGSSSPSTPRFKFGSIVAITSSEPISFVTETMDDPDHPGELLYRVRSWRSESELREVGT